MKKWLLLLGVLGCLSPTAQARDMEGRFGIGLEQSLSGVTGLAIRYFTHELFTIQAAIGADLLIYEGDVSVGVAGSAGVAFHLARGQHAHLWVGARVAVGYRTLDALQLINPDATDSDIHIAAEIPLGLEVWLSDNFSLGASTGILIDIVPEKGAQLHGSGAGSGAPPGAIGIGLGAGTVTGTLTVLYYF